MPDRPEPEMPANEDAERALLGAVMLDNGAFYEVSENLAAADFWLDSHRRIFQAMEALADAGQSIDTVTLMNHFAAIRQVDAIGGVAYLFDLTDGLPRRPVVRDYVRIVKDKSMARQMIAATERSAELARCGTALEAIGGTLEALEGISASVKGSARQIAELLPSAVQRFHADMDREHGQLLGARLLTSDMDRALSGIQDGELCLLAARPGQGKTEGALQIALTNARHGLRVHIQSLEMKRDALLRRLWRLMARVPVWAMRDPRCLKPDERRRIQEAQEELADLPIQIDDQHELTISEFRSRAVLAAKRWKADLMIVDYGQLLLVPRSRSIIEAAPKQAETLRHIARDYCRMLALVQLRRTPPNDLNRYPDIEDILGSSAWEQAAQIILMFHRTRENKRYTGEDYCFLGKMRELQTIEPFGIKAEIWGEFKDRQDAQSNAPHWQDERENSYV